MSTQIAAGTTVDKIISVALLMVQQHGLNGFSFRDVARLVGIKTASIHYHFPTKPDLARAVLKCVRDEFDNELRRIDSEIDQINARMQAFIYIFERTFGAGDRLCPFCMVACAQNDVPSFVREEVQKFWSCGEQWVAQQLEQGKVSGHFRRDIDAEKWARMLIATLEGAMLTARAFDDRSRLEDAGKWFLQEISG